MTLTININSFSYRRGIPKDTTGNGGGFVFDCRGIYNPGRIDGYKTLSGLDQEVREFLETQSSIAEFLTPVYQLVDSTVDNYLSRDFAHLQVNFGCTGGQHRSVYAAEQTAKHLKTKYPDVVVRIEHTNKEHWKKTL
ncbi:MAG: ATP-binding protein [Flavobacteriia bacterium]|nr:MAG: ATP-binding protein [Flavobacteriia bacterium]